jgi:hypothetical protein
VPTFKKEAKNANLAEGALHMAVAGVVTGFITGLYYMIFGSTITSQIFPLASGFTGATFFIISLIATPIYTVIAWLIGSGILYIFALLFGGKGDYKTQSYLYAIYSAPLGIITTVLLLIPFLGIFLALLVAIYGLYLLTMVLKEAHKYTTGRAVLTWLVPIGIIVLIVIVLAGLAFMFLLGAFVNGTGSIF